MTTTVSPTTNTPADQFERDESLLDPSLDIESYARDRDQRHQQRHAMAALFSVIWQLIRIKHEKKKDLRSSETPNPKS